MKILHVGEESRSEVGDGELITRFRRGDSAAARLLHDRHANGLYAYARSLLGDDECSKDVVRDAFVRLLTYDPAKAVVSVRAFLFGVARNLCVDLHRDAAVKKRHRLLHVAPAAEPETLTHLQAALVSHRRDLPPDQRETVEMKKPVSLGQPCAGAGRILYRGSEEILMRMLLALAVVAFIGQEGHDGKVPWIKDPAAGLQKAKLEGKVAMLWFTADW